MNNLTTKKKTENETLKELLKMQERKMYYFITMQC